MYKYIIIIDDTILTKTESECYNYMETNRSFSWPVYDVLSQNFHLGSYSEILTIVIYFKNIRIEHYLLFGEGVQT